MKETDYLVPRWSHCGSSSTQRAFGTIRGTFVGITLWAATRRLTLFGVPSDLSALTVLYTNSGKLFPNDLIRQLLHYSEQILNVNAESTTTTIIIHDSI